MKDGKNVATGYAGTSYEDYCKRYDELVASDAKDEYGYYTTLSTEEKDLESLMNRFREKLIGDKYVYAVRDEKPQPRVFPPIRAFYEVRKKIDADPLLGTFKRMPKGGNLHIHTSSTISADDFIDMLIEFDKKDKAKVVVYMGTDGKYKFGQYTILYLEKDIPSNDFWRMKNLSPDQKADLLSHLTMSDDRINDIKYIWDEFDDIFQRVYHVLAVREIYQKYYTEAFKRMIDDNTGHVELRFGPSILKDSNDDEVLGNPYTPDDTDEAKFESVKLINDCYKAAQNYADSLGKFFTLRLVVTSSRKKKEDIKSTIDDYKKDIAWVIKYRDKDEIKDGKESIIVGYDLVSEEDRGWNTNDVAEAFFDNDKMVDVPFLFHDGESCWADNRNVFSAVTLGSVRIGHGINLYHFPDVLEEVRHRNVTLEVCPISNQLLRYTQDLRIHPVAEYMKRGLNCVICNDDPQIFNYNGLAYDFWEIYYSQMIGLGAIKRLVFNSIQFSMLGKQKSTQIDKLQKEWAAFVKEEIKILEKINR
ncbi:hypothetical protein D6856_14415 [Butyrivibrio sp. XB500-5]|uniref:hypothetical protein n=1 Tax=Butyrivibrio sp. XB500-5 TaxID=2364880 RepID=UPI000EA92C5D|nr:hypothetical protein [Butyrivibrio sp. XB500-5]RKM56966.1 hypothetical protein D6856_14415 [Butyrivibrio sp. XB500-5]